MQLPGLKWRHIILGTKRSWHHGDKRGFRSRHHRRHSSGDYKNPPPESEHEGLRRHSEENASGPVIIPRHLRPVVGTVFRDYFKEHDWRILCVSISGKHAHALVELPDDMRLIRSIVGKAKNISSRAVRKELPGRMWATGGNYKPIKDREHQINSYVYITTKQGPNAWIWSFRDGVMQGEV